jgi:DNA polymerase-3 subunit alpha
MAALLTSVKDSKDAKPFYLHIARKMKIDVLLPDVNTSDKDFTPVKEAIRFGLSAIRGVGENVVEKIVEARRESPFESFHDFCNKVDYTCLNRKTVESLIKAGAFEALSHSRKGLLESFETICSSSIERRKNQAHGQWGFFDDPGTSDSVAYSETPIAIDEYPKDLVLKLEKEALGMYVSDHPLMGIEGLLARMCDVPLAGLKTKSPGEFVTIGGLVASLNKRVTRRGDIMVLLDLEDLSGAAVEVVVFARTYQQFGALLGADEILLIKGRVDRDARDDSVKVMAQEIHKPNLGEARPLEITLPVEACTSTTVDTLKDVLTRHPGSTQVFLHLDAGSKTTVLRLGSEYAVDTTNGLHAELKTLLGSRALVTA